jgi:hypothetical protein
MSPAVKPGPKPGRERGRVTRGQTGCERHLDKLEHASFTVRSFIPAKRGLATRLVLRQNEANAGP